MYAGDRKSCRYIKNKSQSPIRSDSRSVGFTRGQWFLPAPQRQLYMKRRSHVFRAVHCDLAVMIADDRLCDGEAQSGAVLLGSVIRREESFAFFRGESCAGVGDVEDGVAISYRRQKDQLTAPRHGIDGIEHQVS